MNRDCLTGWKAIANYIDRTTKTAMLYAKKYHMPVYRGPGQRPYAFTDEIKRWIKTYQEKIDAC